MPLLGTPTRHIPYATRLNPRIRMLLFSQYPGRTRGAMLLPMNTSPSPSSSSPIQAAQRNQRGAQQCATADCYTVVFKLGLDLSPLGKRQNLIARTLLQRLTGKTSSTATMP